MKGKKTVPVLLFWAVSFLIFVPNQLYLQNISEFRVSFPNFLFTFLGWTVIYMLVATIGCLFFIPDQILNYFLGFIFAMTICGYLQDNFLNGTMSPLDGMHQSWSVATQLINIGIWSILIAGCLFLVWKWKEKLVNVLRIVSIYLVLIHIVTLGFLIASTDWNNNHIYALTTDKMLELDTNNNVVVFVLDWYDEQVLEEINKEEPEFLEPLQGFTWYQNQTSRYAFTDMSIPYLLSGVEWKEGTTEEEYTKYADENGEFLQDIQKNGYDIGIYTESQLVKDSKHIVCNFTNRSRGNCKFYTTLKKLVKCARYQRMPFILKKDYWYTTADLSDIAADKNLYGVDNLSFYYRITPDKLETKKGDRNGAFRFYHISGVHDLKITENRVEEKTNVFSEGKGAMKIVYDYLEQMKKMGVYDTATIIITADHGQNYLNRPEELKQRNLQMTSNPILLVKKRAKSEGFEISKAPVSHTDFFATVMKAIEKDNLKYGLSYDEIPEDEKRVREMIFYRTQDVPCTRFKIDGMATEQNSWLIETNP